MKIRKNYCFMAILLLITLMIQPMQLIKAQVACGAVVTGASGTQYTRKHAHGSPWRRKNGYSLFAAGQCRNPGITDFADYARSGPESG
jgi:hypothetical protein